MGKQKSAAQEPTNQAERRKPKKSDMTRKVKQPSDDKLVVTDWMLGKDK